MEYEVEGPRLRGRPKGPGEVVEKDCQPRKLIKEDAMDCRRWRKVRYVRLVMKISGQT